MLRYLSWIPTVALLAGLSSPAVALRMVVPDDAPTIQAALDAGADTVAVRDGLTPERLTVTRFVLIEPAVHHQLWGAWQSSPSIQSIEVRTCAASARGAHVRGCRFLGPVYVDLCDQQEWVTFESCRFDSTFTSDFGYFTMSSLRGCLFLADVTLWGYVQFIGNTVIGSTLTVRADGLTDIRNNYFQGSPGAAMRLNLADGAGPVAWNTIRGAHDGIHFVFSDGNARVVGNDIADCSGDGIVYPCTGSSQLVHCDSNRIERCGGAGIAIRGDCPSPYIPYAYMSGNVIKQTGAGGIDLGTGNAMRFLGNVVLDAGGDGIRFASADSCMDNVVGRSDGAGIRITSWRDLFNPPSLAGNTVFSNAGPGIHLSSSVPSTGQVTHNISAFNNGGGLRFDGPAAPPLSCNDWFLNRPAATIGVAPGPTDLALDPQFCDLGSADVRLAASSPLLAASGCGLIGALGMGCGAASSLAALSLGPAVHFHAWPVPASGKVAFEIPPSSAGSTLEVFDVTGARRWQSTIPVGATRLEWDRRGLRGEPAAPGVYFARLRRDGVEVARVRLVLNE